NELDAVLHRLELRRQEHGAGDELLAFLLQRHAAEVDGRRLGEAGEVVLREVVVEGVLLRVLEEDLRRVAHEDRELYPSRSAETARLGERIVGERKRAPPKRGRSDEVRARGLGPIVPATSNEREEEKKESGEPRRPTPDRRKHSIRPSTHYATCGL